MLNNNQALKDAGIIVNENNYEECRGQCPYCKSDNLSYDDNGIEDEYYWYHIICNDCGKKSKEWYRLEYLDTEKL